MSSKAAVTKRNQDKSVGAPASAWKDAGFAREGFENQTGDDVLIPILSIAHGLSKVVQGDLIEGIKVGDLYNTVTMQKYEKPVIVIPCSSEHYFDEQLPDGTRTGQLIMRHTADSQVVLDAKEDLAIARAKDPKIPYGKFETRGSGHDLVEKFVLYCLRLADVNAFEPVEQLVITFRGFGIRYYKALNTALDNRPGGPPMFANRVAVSTFPDRNKAGKEFPSFLLRPAIGEGWEDGQGLKAPADGEDPHPLLLAGRAMRDLAQQGMIKAVQDTDAEAGESVVEESDREAGAPDVV
jgi:hypothetical protein